MTTDLNELREKIQSLDAEILRLVAARMETATRIGQTKRARGIPLRDWQVERAVLEKADQTARGLKLPLQISRAVMQTLIAGSRVEQERIAYADYSGSTENIAVIGGQGKMGRWFVEFLSNQGHRVEIFDLVATPGDTAHTRSLDRAVEGTSFALIATPLETVPAIIDHLLNLNYRGVIFDIASLKSHLKPAIERARAAQHSITSIHPMFGPSTRTLSDQVICLCDCGDAESTRRVRAFFSDTAATLVELTLDEHDRVASLVLGLSHLINIAFMRVLAEGEHSFNELNRVGSTTFHAQVATAANVIRENPDLYYSIQQLNPHSPRVYDDLLQELSKLMNAVKNGDRRSFADLMTSASRWLS
ncbi:MAG: prephenate dehydrogenase/arogenate dehydrogenase family protein [Planctomycetes bacterium]|nr:prephenate dehydrogenase/arogenate dehydrogenase family protein [Planctomycetota bacterium]MBI3834621.1 prephenate dehydrogenase/arogenate dehydrogenase family protein [Planctomycetota bacterium]